MKADIIFIMGLTIVGVLYLIYEIVDRICQYKERTSIYGKDKKNKEE